MAINMLKDCLKDILVCPRDHHKLTQQKDTLNCPLGHIYPIIEGIPIMLLNDKTPTQAQIFNATLKAARLYEMPSEFNQQQNNIQSSPNNLDPFVNEAISATCGIMYKSLMGKLTQYPIPNLPLPKGEGKYFLDLGCNWGRWSINAAKLGYTVVGIDPNLDAIKAARRVAKQLNLSINYAVADARYLPFLQNTFDVIFSYSVLQHFDKDDTKLCLSKISRALKARGIALIQLPNTYGPRNLYNQLKNKFKKPADFDVRYWRPSEILKTFYSFIGPTTIFTDGFFSLNAQNVSKDILPYRYRLVITCSDILCGMSEKINWLKYIADSLYITSRKQ